jgi:3-hydroxyisobutyrate dehydrogenase-like beta-hydroxyacid dehydrogenase
MFGIFKKIKTIIMKKEEIEQQLAEAIAVAQRLGAENKQLRQVNNDLTAANAQLTEDFNGAVERVRYLADQLKMRESQQKATSKFNDNNRNY